MTHLLVAQLRFARSEFVRCLAGVSAEDGMKRVEPMNCLSWIVGHLANHEHFLWVQAAQGQNVAPNLHSVAGYGSPPGTPPWDEMWQLWELITHTADGYLDTLTTDKLQTYLEWQEQRFRENIGTTLYRNIYHIWFHLGEAHAVRQMLGHADLPQFVGNMSEALYHAE